MRLHFLILHFGIICCLNACLTIEDIPLPKPTVTPTPSPSPTNPRPALFKVNLAGPLYKLEFGPGSKGFEKNFGPGSKGFEYEFGPGSKGFGNLHFRVDFMPKLLRQELASFSIQSNHLKVDQVQIKLLQEQQIVAQATILPKEPTVQFKSPVPTGSFLILARAEGNFEPLEMLGNALTLNDQDTAEVRVRLHANKLTREALDIEILTRTGLREKLKN